jgi:hypothetical protein
MFFTDSKIEEINSKRFKYFSELCRNSADDDNVDRREKDVEEEVHVGASGPDIVSGLAVVSVGIAKEKEISSRGCGLNETTSVERMHQLLQLQKV